LSKLSDFMSSGEQPKAAKIDLEVDVSCQICFEYVDDAEYYPIEKLLKWKCSQGHVSFIEEFRL